MNKLTEYATSIGVTAEDAAEIIIRAQGVVFNRFGLTDLELILVGAGVIEQGGPQFQGAVTAEVVAQIIQTITGRKAVITPPRQTGWAGHQRASRITIEEPNEI